MVLRPHADVHSNVPSQPQSILEAADIVNNDDFIHYRIDRHFNHPSVLMFNLMCSDPDCLLQHCVHSLWQCSLMIDFHTVMTEMNVVDIDVSDIIAE